MVNSKNIRYPETSIQDQSILAKVFAPTVYIECNILCNYRVNIDLERADLPVILSDIQRVFISVWRLRCHSLRRGEDKWLNLKRCGSARR